MPRSVVVMVVVGGMQRSRCGHGRLRRRCVQTGLRVVRDRSGIDDVQLDSAIRRAHSLESRGGTGLSVIHDGG